MDVIELESIVIYYPALYADSASLVSALPAELFTDQGNRNCLEAIQRLYKTGRGCDSATIMAELEIMGKDPAVWYEVSRLARQHNSQKSNLKTLISQLKAVYKRNKYQELGRCLTNADMPLEEMDAQIESCFDMYASPIQLDDISEEGELAEWFGNWGRVKCGIPFIDDTGGFWDTEQTILAARPGMGKTSIAIAICLHVLMNEKKPVVFFTGEMTKKEIICRMLTNLTGVFYNKIRDNKYSSPAEEEFVKAKWQWMKKEFSGKLFLNDRVSTNIKDIAHAVKDAARCRKPALCILDHIGMYKGEGDTQEQRMADKSLTMKELAKSCEIPTLILSQLNRAVESRVNKEPVLSDLRESGAIEQDANNVYFLWEDEQGRSFLTRAKGRNIGTGCSQIRLVKNLFRIEKPSEFMVEP